MHPTSCESLSVFFQGNELFADPLQARRETEEEAWGFPAYPSHPFPSGYAHRVCFLLVAVVVHLPQLENLH